MECDICNCELNEVDGEIVNGKCLKFVEGDEEYFVLRCDKCFEKDTTLKNYKPTECYTRTVGYYRPVQQFHKGKIQEYKERLEFKCPCDDTI